jgi:phosphatidylserine/phosphatidylglycerophosphate/cardiolipin synthase-like enzyme
MGSHGTVPLTVIAPLADVIRHVSNVIARAEREVFFITCNWSPSVAQRLVRNALVELSRRAGERRQRVVVKIMYDKATAASAIDPHQRVSPAAYSGKAIQLPAPDEVPHLDMEVVSLHKLVLGTLHAKFCVVDRKIALVMSNNMEDNCNMEMLTHLEGPIVDSIYDTALITWKRPLDPPLPSYEFPAALGGLPPPSSSSSTAQHEQQPLYLDRGGAGADQQRIAASGEQQSHGTAEELKEHTPEDPHYDADLAGEIVRMQACYSTKPDETRLQAANRLLNYAVKNPVAPTGPEIPDGHEMTPYIDTSTPYPVPMALVSRPPYGSVDSKNAFVPQNEAWLSLIRNATRDIFIQTPDLNAAPLMPALAEALKRGVEVTYYVCFGYNDAGEVIPGQGGTNEQAARSLLSLLPEDGPERKLLRIYDYVGKDQDRPIHQCFRARCCHVKLLIVDGCVGVQGSGNQDTQSWFHSQEMNIMVDSAEICAKWREGIERNQNTRLYGRVAADGVWRDEKGQPGEGYMGDPGSVEGLIKGVWGMYKKMERA